MPLRLRAPEGRPWTFKEIVQGHPLAHPTHALLVHYPIAFPPLAVALDLAARAGPGEPVLVSASAYVVVAAALLALVAAIPGLLDWWGMIPGSPKRRVGTLHLIVQSVTIALLVLSAALRWPERDAAYAPWPATLIAALAAVTVLVGNYFGGELVYRMGMRVSTSRTPETLED